MFKQLYICHNLKLLDEVQKLIAAVQNTYDSDKAITDTVSLADVAKKVNGDYRETLSSRNKWQQIRQDEVLLTALRDELKRLSSQTDFTSQAG